MTNLKHLFITTYKETFVLQIRLNYMNNRILINPISFKPTSDIDQALKILQSKGFDRSKFIRLAIEEKLYKDYRQIVKHLDSYIIDENVPDFAR